VGWVLRATVQGPLVMGSQSLPLRKNSPLLLYYWDNEQLFHPSAAEWWLYVRPIMPDVKFPRIILILGECEATSPVCPMKKPLEVDKSDCCLDYTGIVELLIFF